MTLCSPWATEADLCPPCAYDTLDSALLDDSLLAASAILYEFTGRRWPGVCTDTIRPIGCCCGRPHAWSSVEDWAYSYLHNGRCGGCGCSTVSEITLPGRPVISVDEVRVDGVVLTEGTDYRLDDARHLVRLPDAEGRHQSWPCSQREDLADTEEHTWSVAYTWGAEPMPGGVQAAATLACQLALACTLGQESLCRFPKRVTAITRQGITVAVLDPLTLFADGRTGLSDVDLWIGAANYGARKRRAGVYVPGASRKVRRPA